MNVKLEWKIKMIQSNHFMDNWLAIDTIQQRIKKEFEEILKKDYSLSLKEFYVLYYLSQAKDKKLRLQQLQEMIGLSQSALSRLVAGMEAESCGALQKHTCEDDRRGTYTSITELGESKLQRSLVSFQEILNAHFAKADFPDHVKQLINNL